MPPTIATASKRNGKKITTMTKMNLIKTKCEKGRERKNSKSPQMTKHICLLFVHFRLSLSLGLVWWAFFHVNFTPHRYFAITLLYCVCLCEYRCGSQHASPLDIQFAVNSPRKNEKKNKQFSNKLSPAFLFSICVRFQFSEEGKNNIDVLLDAIERGRKRQRERER